MNTQSIAEEILGAIDWQSPTQGYCDCPGKQFHTTANGKRDCKVMIDSAPTITCFHASCSLEVEKATTLLRSRIGKEEWKNRPSMTPGKFIKRVPMDAPSTLTTPVQHMHNLDEIITTDQGEDIPPPMEDGTRKLLKAVFKHDDVVAICGATMDESGKKEIPDGGGLTLSRDEWLAKLDSKGGNINSFYSSSMGCGVYIRINPMKDGGVGDKDVTAYRHALIEFDNLSIAEQWRIYRHYKIPCAAIIHSGGKSLHAWVKVEASDLNEYRERVNYLYKLFEQHNPDTKNINPSRFSRIPGCRRFGGRQELLAINVGANGWNEWMQIRDLDAAPKPKGLKYYANLDTSNDASCVIGFDERADGRTVTTRYLCEGKSAWLLGPSGVGKSSLVAEFAIGWARGKPVFGIRPREPLKSLIIQAENDDHDIGEMLQGVIRANCLTPEQIDDLDSRVLFLTEIRRSGDSFIAWLNNVVAAHEPDILWVDPLLSFAGINVSDQQQVTHFLRTCLNPMLETAKVVMIGVHHTGKPKSVKETANWTAIDYAYSGLGSSEMVNWARAVMVVKPVTSSQFELKLAKRGKRAGAKDLKGNPTNELWIEHALHGIKWVQIDAPKAEGEDEAGGEGNDRKKPAKVKPAQKMASLNLHQILWAIPSGGISPKDLSKQLEQVAMEAAISLTAAQIKRQVLPLLVDNGKLAVVKGCKYIKGPNA